MTESIHAMSGMMSTEAMAQMKEKMFTKLDSDGDGALNRTELESFAEELSQKSGQTVDLDEFISSLDSDGDGIVSQDEFMTGGPTAPPPPPPQETESDTSNTLAQYLSRIDGDDTTQTLLEMLNESVQDESINILA
ncbi:MAG: EF-hand domain-containing protein [Candidatus Zixiibacteriota bacterium]